MAQRLQKILSGRGIASRRKSEQLILSGRITVNGVVANLGDTADENTDEILVDGSPLPSSRNFVYILLNKPRGYVTTLADEKNRPNVSQLVADCGMRVYPVGRLDMDSEGLLLLTNDGDFTNILTHPRHEVAKTYEVWVTGFHAGADEKLQAPIILDGHRIHPPAVRLLRATGSIAHLLVTIHEGRNRQVRRMCAAAGMHVTRLRRIQEGTLKLGDLPKGTWRFLTPEEVSDLRNAQSI